MKKYYTRACNFYYGKNSRDRLSKSQTISLNNNKDISFDTIEIVSRESKKKYNINNLKLLGKEL